MNAVCCIPNIVPHVNGIYQENWRDWNGLDWILTEDWFFKFESDYLCVDIEARKGYKTDFGSIPPWYRCRLNQMGVGIVAFLPHDCVYQTEAIDRKTADRMMYDMLRWVGVQYTVANAAYLGVRMGGGFVWASHTDLTRDEAWRYIDVDLTLKVGE